MGFVIFPIVAAGVAAAAFFGIRVLRQTREAWRRAASILGLSITTPRFGYPTIRGRSGEMEVVVDTFTQGGGNNSQTYTRYRVYFPPFGVGLRLRRQTGLSRVSRFFGAQDLEVGDTGFDDAFMVKSAEPARIGEVLRPSVRTALLRLASVHPGMELDDDHLAVSLRGVERSVDRLVTITRRLQATAAAVRGAGREQLDAAVAARGDGDLAAARERVTAAVEEHPEDLEARLLEAEMLAAGGDTAGARERIERLASELPADPEVAGWRERLAAPAPAPADPAGPAVAAAELAERLFSGTELSFETDRVFAEIYRGRRVEWEGRVRSVRAYDVDADFGAGPGVKLVVTIATIEHDLYGQTRIDAVLALPAGSGAGLERNDPIAFSGVLTRVDPLMRNVFVEQARVA